MANIELKVLKPQKALSNEKKNWHLKNSKVGLLVTIYFKRRDGTKGATRRERGSDPPSRRLEIQFLSVEVVMVIVHERLHC